MLGTILIAIATLMHPYVFWRVASVPWVKSHVSPRLLAGAGVVLWVILVLGRLYGHGGDGAVPATVESIGMSWLAMLFLLTVSFLATDVLTGFGYLLPRLASSMRGLSLAVGGVLTAIALFQGLRPPAVEDYEVRLPGLPKNLDGTVFVAMSDLHLGARKNGRWLAECVAQVNALRPDLVVLLGDIFEGHGPPQRDFIPMLRMLSAPLGVWAVPGNHESNGGADPNMLQLEETGIQVLRNRWAQVRPGLVLAGVEDLATGLRPGKGGDSIERALAGRPPGACILLNHKPWLADRAARTGAGLMLSGHTHGGQIWPLGYITRMIYPLLDGEYDVEDMKIIVCRGTGTWGPPMRLWRRSQILRVTLRYSEMKLSASRVAGPSPKFHRPFRLLSPQGRRSAEERTRERGNAIPGMNYAGAAPAISP